MIPNPDALTGFSSLSRLQGYFSFAFWLSCHLETEPHSSNLSSIGGLKDWILPMQEQFQHLSLGPSLSGLSGR